MSYNASVLKIPHKIAAAIEVINGIYGVGEERKKNLEKVNYNYEEIQNVVDELFPLFQKYEDK